MDWIERIFHVSPDAGNGSLELLFILWPLVAFLIGFLALIWFFGAESIQSYERQRRVFSWGVIVFALIVLMILIGWLFTTWLAFEKSLGLIF